MYCHGDPYETSHGAYVHAYFFHSFTEFGLFCNEQHRQPKSSYLQVRADVVCDALQVRIVWRQGVIPAWRQVEGHRGAHHISTCNACPVRRGAAAASPTAALTEALPSTVTHSPPLKQHMQLLKERSALGCLWVHVC